MAPCLFHPGAGLVQERLHAVVYELGASTSRARELILLAATSLPEVSLESLLREVISAHPADDATTEALLGAMSARGYAGAILDFLANRDDVTAEDLAAAFADVRSRRQNKETIRRPRVYEPRPGDYVVGRVEERNAEGYKVKLMGAAVPGTLGAVAFDGAALAAALGRGGGGTGDGGGRE